MLSRSIRQGSASLARRARVKRSSLEMTTATSNTAPLSSVHVSCVMSSQTSKKEDELSGSSRREDLFHFHDMQNVRLRTMKDLLLRPHPPTSLSMLQNACLGISQHPRSDTGGSLATREGILTEYANAKRFQEDFDGMSYAFYTTMRNILCRTSTNLSTTTVFNQDRSRNNSGYHNANAMVQYRHFSSTGGPTPTPPSDKSEEPKKQPPCAAKPTATDTAPCSTPAKTPSATIKRESMVDKAQNLLLSALNTLASLLAKTPGILWYYTTHPTEFKAKLTELKDAAKKEAHHYYMGSKLLIADLRTARQMLGQLLQGTPLTRRERKQLIRTVTDVFRLVPMSIFVLIPFMEFALPFALKIFPNMLPSTFQDSLKAEESMKRELKSRLAMAEFFQETLQDLAKKQRKRAVIKKKAIVDNDGPSSDLESTENREETAASFLEFIEKARKGEFLPPEVIVRFAKYFKDEMTLDNMPRMQLINMCRYMSIPPYGNDNVLRFQLRHKIRVLQEDDQKILWEGIDSLTKMELREACQERGMRSTGLSKQAYIRALQQWIDLSVNRNVPISLLIMSRTFFLKEEMTMKPSTADEDESKSVTGLADAISGLDKEVVNEVILEAVTPDQKDRDPDLMKLKLEVLQQQNELIEEEKEQRRSEAAKMEAAKVEKEQGKAEKEKTEKAAVLEIESDVVDKDAAQESAETEKIVSVEEFVTSSTFSDDTAHDETKPATEAAEEKEDDKTDVAEAVEEEEEKSLSTEEIDAISELVSPDPVSAERVQLESIKAALQESDDEDQQEKEEGAIIEDEVSEQTPTEEEVDIPATETAAAATTTTTTAETASPEEPTEAVTVENADKIAEEQILAMDAQAKAESEVSTQISMDGKVAGEMEEVPTDQVVEKEELVEQDYTDEKLNKAVTRLKSKVESMVGNLEIQISDVEAKIGDKLHFLDKDMDGILSREEMVLCLQSVLKRPLSFDEATAIAADMDKNEDGLISLEELSKWLESNKIMKLMEEGRDAQVDKLIAAQAAKMKEQNEKKEED